ncbi:MAG TPA: pyridoxal-phosphate dependent enzyme [Anaerolineae bacterium]|nr:pyridoxal-phosphate dependent enzyme [Anaerolineae bacterium]
MTNPPARPLFDIFPTLRCHVPCLPLADLPTPLAPLPHLSAAAGAEIWVKRDGLSHPVYGGNKMRKFEFVFADAVRRGARAVITGGGLGSHHTLAAAVVARSLTMQPICAYYCQPVTGEVHANLRRTAALGVDAHFCGDYLGLAVSFAAQYVRWFLRTGRPPYFIYPGASGTLGILGYVNAALEIRDQVYAGEAPLPDAILVAAGSCGTFAGLLLGMRLAGLPVRVVGVRVTGEDVANRAKVARLASRAARYLRERDPSVPEVSFEAGEVELLNGYYGPGYAHPTPAAERAVELVHRTERLSLETTYTGKAMAALLDYAEAHPGARLLFVDTFVEAPTLPEGDYHDLPERFWPIFDPAHPARCACLHARRDPAFCWRRT